MKRTILILVMLCLAFVGQAQVEVLNGKVRIKTVDELLSPPVTTKVAVLDSVSGTLELKYVEVQDLPGGGVGGGESLDATLAIGNTSNKKIILYYVNDESIHGLRTYSNDSATGSQYTDISGNNFRVNVDSSIYPIYTELLGDRLRLRNGAQYDIILPSQQNTGAFNLVMPKTSGKTPIMSINGVYADDETGDITTSVDLSNYAQLDASNIFTATNTFSGGLWLSGQNVAGLALDPYDSSWNGSNKAATQDDIYDKIETLGSGTYMDLTTYQISVGKRFTSEVRAEGGIDMDDSDVIGILADPYDSGWDDNYSAPSKNDVYDKIEAISVGGGGYTDEEAQDAVGAMVSSEFTYVDGTPSLTLASNSIASSKILDGTILTEDLAGSVLTPYLTIANAATTYEPIKGTDDNYVTDAEKVVIGNTSGTNTGDQTSIVGITGTKAQYDTSVTDGNFMYIGDAPTAHTHTASEVTDFDTEVANNSAVTANTAKVTDDDDGVAEVYGAGWDGDNQAPTKNDVYDKIETLESSSITQQTITATYDLQPEDDLIFVNNSGAITVTIDTDSNSSFVDEKLYTFVFETSNQVTFDFLSGVTGTDFVSYANTKSVTIMRTDTNTWKAVNAPLAYMDSYVETLYNQSTEPTGIGTQLPNTALFISDVDMLLVQKIMNGTLKYYWIEL